MNNQQKNDLRYSIISGELYFIDNISFMYNNLNTKGILLKPKLYDCECNKLTNGIYCYVTTVYWN